MTTQTAGLVQQSKAFLRLSRAIRNHSHRSYAVCVCMFVHFGSHSSGLDVVASTVPHGHIVSSINLNDHRNASQHSSLSVCVVSKISELMPWTDNSEI